MQGVITRELRPWNWLAMFQEQKEGKDRQANQAGGFSVIFNARENISKWMTQSSLVPDAGSGHRSRVKQS